MATLTDDQKLANAVEQRLRQFVYLPNDHDYVVMSAWILHTHLRRSSGEFLPRITPRLYLGSKKAGCGKSTALEIVTTLSHNGDMVLEATSFGMVSLLNEELATVGIDEVDLYFGRGTTRSAVRAIVNGGYKSGSTLPRQRSGEVDKQRIHGPIAMAGKNWQRFMTADTFDTLRTRSICIELVEKPVGADVERYNPEVHEDRLRGIMRRLKQWGKVNAQSVCSIPIDGLMDPRIANRAEEIWTVLFRVAHYIGGDWPERMSRAARGMVLGEWDEEDTPTISPEDELLACVQEVFTDTSETFLTTGSILDALDELPMPPSIMSEWQNERAAQMGLSRMMSVHGIEHTRQYVDGVQVRGYARADVEATETTSMA